MADDNQTIRRGVADLADQEGCEVCGEASDGAEALQKARALWPDLILLDISMPCLNGLETARRLREEIREVKILIMSHHDPAELLPSDLQAGANGCLDKAQIATDLLHAMKALAADPDSPCLFTVAREPSPPTQRPLSVETNRDYALADILVFLNGTFRF